MRASRELSRTDNFALSHFTFYLRCREKIKSAPFSIFILTNKIGQQDFYCRSYLFLDRCFNRYILHNISKKGR